MNVVGLRTAALPFIALHRLCTPTYSASGGGGGWMRAGQAWGEQVAVAGPLAL